MSLIERAIASLDRNRTVLIAGPTASGKSTLAMAIAAKFGWPVVNADALQVYSDWRVVTARPTEQDETTVPHHLYGHIAGSQSYSVGDWLRQIEPILLAQKCVVVGGTGLYFSALTEGLADIPTPSADVRTSSEARLATAGLAGLLEDLDPKTRARIDTVNPRRVQRAWEVMEATGRGLADWQDSTGPAVLPLEQTQPLVLSASKDWLTPRIETRFEAMMESGALDEARKNAPSWHPDLPSAKAIGAAELIAYVQGRANLEVVREAVTIQTRQYAKRQRSWFRARMQDWHWIDAAQP